VNFGRSRREDANIDLTPMIDIVFQLVLFFMVSTTFISAPGIEVDLPKASADLVVSESEDINIWVGNDGSLFIDDQPVSQDSLKKRLEIAAETNPDTLVVIKADVSVGHGRVVEVMDQARATGLSRIAIATEVDPSAPEP